MTNNFRLTLPVAGLLAIATGAPAALIFDSFDSDTSANYTIVDESNAASGDGTPDSTIAFAFDYSTVGIPIAPRTIGSSTLGLRIAANETENDAGAPDHITAFNKISVTGSYRLTVDMYMGVEAAGGTTEFSLIGVAGNSMDFNSIFSPIAGSGHFLAMTGDGGSGSDYRHSTPDTPAVPGGDASYLNSTNTTDATGDIYQAIFPGGDFAGSPGNRWTTLTIDVVAGGNVTYSLDGTPIIQTATESTDGLVSLGYSDVFSSVGPHFVVFDNLDVSVIPEPSAAMLALLGLSFVARRRR